MEEKLIKVLLDQYKARGIDLYALLDNKFFMGLSLDKRVELIKKYASHISSGTSKSLTKKDINALIFETAFAGITSGILAGQGIKQATKYFTKGTVPYGALAGAVVIGAGVSGLASYMANKRMINNKKEILRKLDEVHKDPSDENALKVLVTRNFQVDAPTSTSISSSAQKRIKGSMGSLPSLIRGQIEPYMALRAFDANVENESPFHEGYDNDSFAEGVQSANNQYLDRISKFGKSVLGD